MFRGTFTALVTPFRDGAVDVAALEKLLEAQIAGGVTGVVPVGTTGESPTLNHEERETVIGTSVKLAGAKCTVLAGTGSNSTRDAIRYTQEAEKLGVHGALVVAPYYNKPSQEGLYRHFRAIAEACSIPIMLYNIPGRCAVDILPDTVLRLAEACPNIVSIKEASGSVERVSELRARLPEKFTILSGDDSLTVPFMAVGAVGVVSVASNLLPAEIVALVRTAEKGDRAATEKLHRRLLPVLKDMFIEPNPVPIKTALAWRGMMLPDCRLPLCEMTPSNQDRFRKTLAAFEQSK